MVREVMHVGTCSKCGSRYIEPNEKARNQRQTCVCGGHIDWGTQPTTRGDATPEMTKDVR